MSYRHDYKLKMSVGNDEYLASIQWTKALDSVFNKRKKRIRDYSILGTLSEKMTRGIGITDDNEVPLIPMKTNWNFLGYRNNYYSSISGPINKVALVCENIIDNENDGYYGVGDGTLLEGEGDDLNSLTIDGKTYIVLGLDADGESLFCINTESYGYNEDIEVIKVKLEDTKFGLEGIVGETALERGNLGKRKEGSESIEKELVNHDYCEKTSEILNLFDVDLQTESATVSGRDIEYYTWNCFFYCQNADISHNCMGTSVTQDDNYIYIFEWLLGAVLRVGQYNSPYTPYEQYPFRPNNCDIYYNMATRQFEGLGNTALKPLLNYAVISKETMQTVQENQIFLDNSFNVDLSDLSYTGRYDITKDTTILLDENSLPNTNIVSSKYPFRAYAACADNEKVYLAGGYEDSTTKLFSLDSADISGENLPETLSVEEVSTNNISEFCHTINRTNLYKVPCLTGRDSYNGGSLINKETGIVNWIGYLNWLVSGVADFEGVSVTAGQIVKFELVEEIINDSNI